MRVLIQTNYATLHFHSFSANLRKRLQVTFFLLAFAFYVLKLYQSDWYTVEMLKKVKNIRIWQLWPPKQGRIHDTDLDFHGACFYAVWAKKLKFAMVLKHKVPFEIIIWRKFTYLKTRPYTQQGGGLILKTEQFLNLCIWLNLSRVPKYDTRLYFFKFRIWF